MNLLRRFSTLFVLAMFPLVVVLWFLLTLLSSVINANLAIVATLFAGFGLYYLLLFGLIRRTNRLMEARQESAGRLLSLMNNVPGVVYRGHRDWSISFIGAEVEAVTGFTADALLNGEVCWKERIHPEDLGAVKDAFRKAVRCREKVLRTEYRFRQREGTYRWIADRRQLIYDQEGEFLYVDGLILDVTERRKSDEALRLTQFAMDRAGDACYWIGPDGRLLYVNEQMCRVLGYSREELLSMSIHDVNPDFPPDGWSSHWESLRRRKSYTLESRHQRKDGRTIPVEVTVNYVEFDGKEYNCASARDLTRRIAAQERTRLLEAQLLEARKMEAIGRLAGGIAHDFNNLLTGILGYADLLGCRAEPGDEVSRASRMIREAAERASRLTAQLLGFSRQGKNLTVTVDLNRTLEDVTIVLERSIDGPIRMRKAASNAPATVVGDPMQLEQCIMNLAMNARDAMPQGGELTLSAEIVALDAASCARRPDIPPGKYVRVEVADTGTGIREEYRGKIFDPFFTTKERGKGTGLGLSMVFGIVKNHGGHIEVESEVGIGTRFRVYVPYAPGDMEGGRRDGPHPADPPTKGRILLIDDQDTVRDVCSTMLAALGYKVRTACDGLEGVESYRKFGRDIDLVIIDMIMPNLGGRECFRRIKEMNPGVRAILSTGFSMDGTVQEIMDEGIAGFIQKPFRLDQLSHTVSQTIGRAS